MSGGLTPAAAFEEVQSYVVIADIVGYSEGSPEDQSRWRDRFKQILGTAIDETLKGRRNIFPAGDGAIVCSYPPEAAVTRDAAAWPIEFARSLLKQNKAGPFNLRIGINYSERDVLVPIGDYNSDQTEVIQVGNGINLAERVLHFAEPNEIVFTEDYFRSLNLTQMLSQVGFYAHHNVFVKHMREIMLFSYRPTPAEEEYMYVPEDPREMYFKRYAYFPPLLPETSRRFRKLGLRDELQILCKYAYDSVAAVNRHSAFISWTDVYEILIRLQKTPDARSLVFSRADTRGFDFWSSDRGTAYLSYLRTLKSKRGLDQRQIFVYDRMIRKELADEATLADLRELESGGSAMSQLHKAHLGTNILSGYIFGVTIFPDLQCAVSPIPTPHSYHDYVESLEFTNVHRVALDYRDVEPGNASLRAFVLAEPERVSELVAAFEELTALPLENVF